MYALKIFSRKWIFFTILVVLGMIGLVRLGFWQLDRMQQKVAYNTTLAERWRLEPYDLNTQALPADRTELAYRRIQAAGEFDYDKPGSHCRPGLCRYVRVCGCDAAGSRPQPGNPGCARVGAVRQGAKANLAGI